MGKRITLEQMDMLIENSPYLVKEKARAVHYRGSRKVGIQINEKYYDVSFTPVGRTFNIRQCSSGADGVFMFSKNTDMVVRVDFRVKPWNLIPMQPTRVGLVFDYNFFGSKVTKHEYYYQLNAKTLMNDRINNIIEVFDYHHE